MMLHHVNVRIPYFMFVVIANSVDFPLKDGIGLIFKSTTGNTLPWYVEGTYTILLLWK